MGPAVVLVGLVALSLLVLGVTLGGATRPEPRPVPPLRRAVPWVLAGMLLVGGALAAIPGVPLVVILGLVAYAGVAVAGTWRMASLDRASPWMVPSRRRARIGFAAIGLTWLGLVLGLLLRIADLLAASAAWPQA